MISNAEQAECKGLQGGSCRADLCVSFGNSVVDARAALVWCSSKKFHCSSIAACATHFTLDVPYVRSVLSNSNKTASSTLKQHLQVPSLAVGELLICCMYQAQPQLQQCSQAQLLQLVTLADSLDATKVAEAATKQLQLFAADPSAELEWETAMQIYHLPPACPETPAYKPLYEAAAKRVQQDLGDLEVVCQDTAVLWPKLLQLPQLALFHLLSAKETCANSEDTVLYVMQSWAAAQPQQPTQQQMQQFCSRIPLIMCSPAYLATVLVGWPLLAQGFDLQDLAMAAVFSCSDVALKAVHGLKLEQKAKDMAMEEVYNVRKALYNSIYGPGASRLNFLCRPESKLGSMLDLQHAVPLAELEMAVAAALTLGTAAGLQEPAGYRWCIPARQGRSYCVWLQAEAVPSTSAAAEAAAKAAATSSSAAAAARAAGAGVSGAAAAAVAARAEGAPEAAAAGAEAGRFTLVLYVTCGANMPKVLPAASAKAVAHSTMCSACERMKRVVEIVAASSGIAMTRLPRGCSTTHLKHVQHAACVPCICQQSTVAPWRIDVAQAVVICLPLPAAVCLLVMPPRNTVLA
jgi:hypothetical protein